MVGEAQKRCLVCAQFAELSGGICQACGERIRGQSQGKRAEVQKRADAELRKHGVTPRRKG